MLCIWESLYCLRIFASRRFVSYQILGGDFCARSATDGEFRGRERDRNERERSFDAVLARILEWRRSSTARGRRGSGGKDTAARGGIGENAGGEGYVRSAIQGIAREAHCDAQHARGQAQARCCASRLFKLVGLKLTLPFSGRFARRNWTDGNRR